MTEQEFQAKASELVRGMVDAIADQEYVKLASIIPPKPSWASFQNLEPTPENDCRGFGQWLHEQLAMWEADYGKKFVVDHFNESCLGEIELENENTSFVTYHPTSLGEKLDFWIEIDFKIENEQIMAVFDVNI